MPNWERPGKDMPDEQDDREWESRRQETEREWKQSQQERYNELLDRGFTRPEARYKTGMDN